MRQRRWALVALSALLALVTAAAGGRVAAAQSTVLSMPERIREMRHHFVQVAALQEAVIRGDLGAVRTAASELVRTPIPPGTLSQAVPFVLAIETSAKRAADAPDVATAAAATAAMLTQCGECHRVVGVHPVPSAPSLPPAEGATGHMLEHQRAADELLQGLVIPSASQWSLGAAGLRAAPFRFGGLPADPALASDLTRADARVHEIADRAAVARDPTAREATYAELLTTCTQCHSANGVVWHPGPPANDQGH